MALTPNIRASQSAGNVLSESPREFRASILAAFAIINFPTEYIRASQLSGLVLSQAPREFRVSSLGAIVLALGRPENRRARAWTFSMDGHDFYVLRLGEDCTLVYDLTTQKWHRWDSKDRTTWRAHQGFNWIGVAKGNYLGGMATNVVAGDDTFGTLWTLDPNVGVDDGPTDARPDPLPYTRVVSGGVPMRMRQSPRCNAVFLTVDLDAPQINNATINLRTSDDNGKTWANRGDITLVSGSYNQELLWRSLGVIRAPGRLFEFTDTGATVRIDDASIRLNTETK